MLEALIDRKLAKAEAQRRGITLTDKEVDEAVTRFKQRSTILDDAAFAAHGHDRREPTDRRFPSRRPGRQEPPGRT